jgi:hypothetical protein
MVPKTDGRVIEGLAAISMDELKARMERGQRTALAQLYRLILSDNGLLSSRHVFQGLRRFLFCDGDDGGDKEKLAYTRMPAADFEWGGDAQGRPTAIQKPAPGGKTFVVIASPNNRHREKYPEIDVWLEHWNWTQMSQDLLEAPIDWIDRYDRKIFTLPR